MGLWTNKQGQALLETLLMASALVSLFTLLLFFIYFCWLQTNLRMISHEYLVCQQFESSFLCQKNFRKQLHSIQRFGHAGIPREEKFPQAHHISIPFKFGIVQWQFHNSISLPLKAF